MLASPVKVYVPAFDEDGSHVVLFGDLEYTE
jgi:hypothetical protein